MNLIDLQYAYGPVPSRRLGKSLGINNIPAKICTYACAYCQVGKTDKMLVERQAFYKPEDIFRNVKYLLDNARHKGEQVDFLTFVPDGEPTLDINLGREIGMLKTLGVPVGVITNSSLIWRTDVREELNKADWVSLKIDTVDEAIWRRINRPNRSLDLQKILDGILQFARHYQGQLVTETMLIRDHNSSQAHIDRLVEFIAQLPDITAYLSIPIRPPSQKWAQAPTEEILIQAYYIFSSKIRNVKLIIEYEGNDFAFSGNVEADLLNITAVHPMREEAIAKLLEKAKSDWSVVDSLIEKGLLVKKEYWGKTFYTRRIKSLNDEIRK
ncbi:MAG TPA: radical SAM protein [Candidatus Marinimicrobia bacterium]|nr:radical SAM protein [Candidatus Neomarinimicrobiota bacterium]HQE95197.1 radical SAM protein [Candidatus Neomarinimicrobiota bacterium]HQH56275.1 radical SAM protein [Candidatus Neomarinimicrobiota bacterium]HQK11378.1 radical SAM protein [Candidatus Neomarinimicrobiota bacterium]